MSFTLSDYHFFDIALTTLNLFSFMLGALWAFFNQGLFGRKIAGPIFLYFGGLTAWYAFMAYAATHSSTVAK